MNAAAKATWIAGLVLLFLLFLATNLNDRKNYQTINSSVENIYSDRLIAKDIIFGLYQAVQEKEINYLLDAQLSETVDDAGIDNRIMVLFDQFAETRLTRDEAKVFQKLEDQVNNLIAFENNQTVDSPPSPEYRTQLASIRSTLHNLSKIQLEEGRNEFFNSKRASETIDLFTNIEIGLLAFIALLILVFIFQNERKQKVERKASIKNSSSGSDSSNKKLLILLLVSTAGFGCDPPAKSPPVTSIPAEDWVRRTVQLSPQDSLDAGSTYLSSYSQIYVQSDRRKFSLTGTISMRNINISDTIYIDQTNYHRTDGQLVRTYFENPIFLAPLELSLIHI